MANLQTLSILELIEKEKCYDSVFLTVDTYKVSTLASGCLLQVCTFIRLNNTLKTIVNLLKNNELI